MSVVKPCMDAAGTGNVYKQKQPVAAHCEQSQYCALWLIVRGTTEYGRTKLVFAFKLLKNLMPAQEFPWEYKNIKWAF